MAGDAFTQIRNAVFRDPRLSAKAMGIFGNISTHRDGWGVTAEAMSRQMRDGVNSIKSGLRELETYGYLKRTRERREDGTLGGAVYFITDQPEAFPDEPELEKPRSSPANDLPTQAEPTLDEPTQAEPTVVDRLHKKTIPLQEDQLVEDDLSLPSVPEQRAASVEREMDAAPNDNPTTTTTPVDAVAEPTTPPAPPPTDSQQQGQQQPQEAAQPSAVPDAAPQAADAIVDAYKAALGRPATRATLERLHDQAAELLDGDNAVPEAWLVDRARELAANGWSDLAKHVERCPVPLPGAQPAAAGGGNGLPPWCGQCGDSNPAAEHNPRFRRTDDGALCHCHPDADRGSHGHGWQPYRNPVDHSLYETDFNGRPLRPLPGTDTNVTGWLALAGQLRSNGEDDGGLDDDEPDTREAGRASWKSSPVTSAAQLDDDGLDDEPDAQPDDASACEETADPDTGTADGWQLMRQMIHANRVKRGTAR
jgi:hypothetical protein